MHTSLMKAAIAIGSLLILTRYSVAAGQDLDIWNPTFTSRALEVPEGVVHIDRDAVSRDAATICALQHIDGDRRIVVFNHLGETLSTIPLPSEWPAEPDDDWPRRGTQLTISPDGTTIAATYAAGFGVTARAVFVRGGIPFRQSEQNKWTLITMWLGLCPEGEPVFAADSDRYVVGWHELYTFTGGGLFPDETLAGESDGPFLDYCFHEHSNRIVANNGEQLVVFDATTGAEQTALEIPEPPTLVCGFDMATEASERFVCVPCVEPGHPPFVRRAIVFDLEEEAWVMDVATDWHPAIIDPVVGDAYGPYLLTLDAYTLRALSLTHSEREAWSFTLDEPVSDYWTSFYGDRILVLHRSFEPPSVRFTVLEECLSIP